MALTTSMCIFSFCILFTLLAGQVAASGLTWCPDRWTSFHGSCYRFLTDLHNFRDSEQQCIAMGGHLAYIDTPLENAFLKDFVTEYSSQTWWIGLTDQGQQGTFRQVGTNIVANYTDFHSNEPSHDGHCVGMYYAYSYDWIDYNCNHPFRAICETTGQDLPPP